MSVNTKSLHIVLDMDETLICFVDSTVWEGLSSKNYHHVNVMDGVCVFRPHLKFFLDKLFAITSDVYIWTRGTRPYAISILNEIYKKTGRKFKHLFSRENCNDAFTLNGYDKDLEYLWDMPGFGFTKRNTILIDDLATNTQNPNNRKNSIQVLPFLISPLIDLYDDNTLLLTLRTVFDVKKMYDQDYTGQISRPFMNKTACINCN